MNDDPQIMLQVIDKAHKTKYNDGFYYAVFLWLSWSNAQTNWGIKPQPMTSTRPCFSCGLFCALDYSPQTLRASFLFLTVFEYIPVTEAFSLLVPPVWNNFPPAICMARFITALHLTSSKATLFKRPNFSTSLPSPDLYFFVTLHSVWHYNTHLKLIGFLLLSSPRV